MAQTSSTSIKTLFPWQTKNIWQIFFSLDWRGSTRRNKNFLINFQPNLNRVNDLLCDGYTTSRFCTLLWGTSYSDKSLFVTKLYSLHYIFTIYNLSLIVSGLDGGKTPVLWCHHKSSRCFSDPWKRKISEYLTFVMWNFFWTSLINKHWMRSPPSKHKKSHYEFHLLKQSLQSSRL